MNFLTQSASILIACENNRPSSLAARVAFRKTPLGTLFISNAGKWRNNNRAPVVC